MRVCATCGGDLANLRPNARYCGAKCRERAKPPRKVVPLPPREGTQILDAITRCLSAEDLKAPRGQLLLRLAGDIDAAPTGASGLAALVREFRATLDDVDAPAQAVEQINPLVELRARHARTGSA